MEGGGGNALSGIQTAITDMATSVQTNILGTITAVLPVVAVIVAAGICVRYGIKFVRGNSK